MWIKRYRKTCLLVPLLSKTEFILLMEEILNHLGCIKPLEYCFFLSTVWGRSSYSSYYSHRIRHLLWRFFQKGSRRCVVYGWWLKSGEKTSWGWQFIPIFNKVSHIPGGLFGISAIRYTWYTFRGCRTSEKKQLPNSRKDGWFAHYGSRQLVIPLNNHLEGGLQGGPLSVLNGVVAPLNGRILNMGNSDCKLWPYL